MLANFLSALDPEATGQCYFVEKTVRCGFTQQERQDHHQFWLSNSDAPAHLKSLNEQGYGTHIAVQRTDGSGYRKRENITAVRSLIVDLDGAPLEPVLDAPLKPHIVIESSPGRYHVYWLVEIGSVPLDLFTPLQEVLNARFSADDGVKDLSHTLRLPGFYHRKREPFLSRIVQLNDHSRYPAEWVEAWLPIPPPAPPRQWDGNVNPLFLRLYDLFDRSGLIARERNGFFDMKCPNEGEHSGGHGQAVARLYLPSEANKGQGGFKCFHGHCAHVNIRTFYKALQRGT